MTIAKTKFPEEPQSERDSLMMRVASAAKKAATFMLKRDFASEIDDIVQIVVSEFLKYEQDNAIKNPEGFASKRAGQRSLDFLRAQRKRQKRFHPVPVEDLGGISDDGQEELARIENLEWVHQNSLKYLTEIELSVLKHHLDGRNPQEIAETTERHPRHVNRVLRDVISRLKQLANSDLGLKR